MSETELYGNKKLRVLSNLAADPSSNKTNHINRFSLDGAWRQRGAQSLRSTKRFPKAAAVATWVLLIALVAASNIGYAATAGGGTAEADLEGTLFVRGVGIVEVEPDQVIFTFSAQALRPTASEAMAEQARQIARANEVLQKFGIPARDIQTLQISLREEWEYVQSERVFRGYVAEQRVQVAVDDISRVGALIDALVQEAGIESIQNIRFNRKDRQSAAMEALKAAYKHAESRALALAAAAGLEIDWPGEYYGRNLGSSFDCGHAAGGSSVGGTLFRQCRDNRSRRHADGRGAGACRVCLSQKFRVVAADRSIGLHERHSDRIDPAEPRFRTSGVQFVHGPARTTCRRRVEERFPSDRVCTMELRTLMPGSSASFPFYDLDDLHRVRIGFELNIQRSGSTEWLTTEAFVVEA